MKPHWWHFTFGPVTVMFETTFFLIAVGAFAVRTSANALPASAKSTAEQNTVDQ